METIYTEMEERNYALTSSSPFIADPLLLDPASDGRRCVALVARGVWSAGPLAPLLEGLPSLPYFVAPKFHHTFLVCRGWGSPPLGEGEAESILQAAAAVIPRYRVVFDRVVPVITGVALCGLPSFDLNGARDLLREGGHARGERYHLDIAHATLLRCVRTPPREEQDSLLRKIREMPRGVYHTLDVTHLDLVEASWTMEAQTYRRLGQITLR